MKIKQVVGDNIRHIRIQNNLTLDDLSVMTKMSRTHLNAIELARYGIGIEKLYLIAKALKVEPHVLLIANYYKTYQIKTPEAPKKPRASSTKSK